MKKILSIALAAVMVIAILAVNVFAADTTAILEIGPDVFTLKQSERADIAKSGTYTFTAHSDSPINANSNGAFIGIKPNSGNVDQTTALPDGTTITVKSVKFDGTEVAVKADKATYTVASSKFDFILKLLDFGYSNNIFDGELPTYNDIEVVIEVNNPEAPADAPAAETPADSAPAEDNTPADSAPAEDNTPADSTPEAPKDEAPAKTGIVLAVLPMMAAAAAVVVSKKR